MAWDSLLKKQIEPPLTLRESHISLMWFICSIGYIHTPVLLGILTSLLSMLILSRNWHAAAAAAAKSLQSCPTLCDPTDGTPPGTAIPGIIQARTPEWVAISFSNAWKWKVKVKLLGRVWLLLISLGRISFPCLLVRFSTLLVHWKQSCYPPSQYILLSPPLPSETTHYLKPKTTFSPLKPETLY